MLTHSLVSHFTVLSLGVLGIPGGRGRETPQTEVKEKALKALSSTVPPQRHFLASTYVTFVSVNGKSYV